MSVEINGNSAGKLAQKRIETKTFLMTLRSMLADAPRIGDDIDDPEGRRYIQISDTLARKNCERIDEILAQDEISTTPLVREMNKSAIILAQHNINMSRKLLKVLSIIDDIHFSAEPVPDGDGKVEYVFPAGLYNEIGKLLREASVKQAREGA